MRFAKPVTLLVFCLGGVLGLWAFWVEPASLRVSTTEIEIAKWPKACDGMEVLVLADLHVGSPYYGLEQLREVVAKANNLNPDLILLAGDFVIHGVVGGSFVEPEHIAKESAQLRARLGVYAVLGNHDWWHDPVQISRTLESAGIAVLEDASLAIHDGACQLWLAGISDYWEGEHDVDKALRDIPEASAIIAFTHNPDVFVSVPERVAITFAGHTHGGQVNLPLLGRLKVPSRYGERFAAGHIREDGRDLFVSTGLGTSILPVRFRVPPEIAKVTIRSAEQP